MSLKGLQGVWSDVQRLSRILLLVVEKLSEDVGDHLSAQREVSELILLLLGYEKLEPVAGNDGVVSAVTVERQAQTVGGGRLQSTIRGLNVDLPESVD